MPETTPPIVAPFCNANVMHTVLIPEQMFQYNPPIRMSIKSFFLKLIGKRPKPTTGHRIYQISDSLQVQVKSLAQREGLPEEEFISDLVAAGLVQYLGSAEFAPKWRTLTRREKEVAGLISRGLTNRQIAGRLSLSTQTVNTHVQNILRKFELSDKAELRHILALSNFQD